MVGASGYYDDMDIAFVEEVQPSIGLDELFKMRDLKQRKLYFNDEVDQFMAAETQHHILQFNAEDKGKAVEDRQPIILYLSSPGGAVGPGFQLIDTILNSKTPVYTVNTGFQYSMAFMIGLAGHKRFATPNATFLMHDGSGIICDSGAKVQDRMEFERRLEDRTRKYILSRSKLTEEEYDSKYRVEWYLFADEAKEKGFCDYIIGTDCDINEIV